MKTTRYILRLIAAFFARFKAIIILGIVAGVALFFILSLLLLNFGSRSSQRIGVVGRYVADDLPTEILLKIGGGLTKINEMGDVSPNLATSWETPDKGKTWVFHLGSDALWQDESSVKSADINYQFSDLEAEKPDEKTIVFKLKDPYSAFPSVVSRPIFKKGLLGTGEWKVKKISLSGGFTQRLTLENKNKAKLVYKFYPTEERAKLAFKLGEIDELNAIINPKPLNSWGRAKIEEGVDKGEFVAVFFNTQDSALSDKVTRQALAYAIDKTALGGSRALGPISENSWAYNPQVKPYNYDLNKAKKDVTDGYEITLTTLPHLLATAEKIAKNWEEAGVKVNVQILPTVPENYQALLAIFDIPEDPDQYSMWHTTQTSTNITKYSSPRIDKLLEDGRTEINLEERKKIYLDFQRFLVEDSPAIFLYYPTSFTIKR
jgi:peptide/nickel transport system substrate-binding protein